MTVQLLGQEFEVQEGHINYMTILSHFKALAEEAMADFKQEYNSTLGTIIFKFNYAEKFKGTYGNVGYMDTIVKRYITHAREYLTQYGVYTLSDNDIWNGAVLNNNDRYASHLQEALNDYIVDLAERDLDDDSFVSCLQSKFSSNFFPSHLYNDIMATCDYVISYVEKNGIMKIRYIYESDVEKAKAIYENLMASCADNTDRELEALKKWMLSPDFDPNKNFESPTKNKVSIDTDTKKRLSLELLTLDPRQREYYAFIFENFPEDRFAITRLATDMSIDLYELVDADIRERFNLDALTCENDAIRMNELLNDCMSSYGISSCSRQKELQKKLTEFDIKARTYDGLLYNTRELRAQAEKDDCTLEMLHGDINVATKEYCNRCLSEIAHMEIIPEIKKKHLQLLNDRIYQIDITYLDGLVTGLAASSEDDCNRIKATIGQYDAPQDTKTSYIAKIDKRIYSIWDKEDFERFAEIFTQTEVGNSEQVGKNGALIQNSGRTETKELFIRALYLLNENEVETAARYAVAKEGGFFSSLINMGKKESYEILTLNGRVIHPAITRAMEAVKAKKNSGGFFAGFMHNKLAPTSTTATTSTAAKFCPECGAKIEEVPKFCPNCGNKLS